jgi:hypothetical protein
MGTGICALLEPFLSYCELIFIGTLCMGGSHQVQQHQVWNLRAWSLLEWTVERLEISIKIREARISNYQSPQGLGTIPVLRVWGRSGGEVGLPNGTIEGTGIRSATMRTFITLRHRREAVGLSRTEDIYRAQMTLGI